jgi:hypothetical protein
MADAARTEQSAIFGDEGRPTYHVSVVALLFAVVAGPFIWAAHLSSGVAVAPWQCQEGTTWPINVLTLVLGLLGVASMAVAWRIHVRARRAGDAPRARAVAFIALVGFLWGGISLAATILEGIPNLAGVTSCPF